jgi:hypothetical protein
MVLYLFHKEFTEYSIVFLFVWDKDQQEGRRMSENKAAN